MEPIFHIAERSRFENAKHEYTPESFSREGFVHCSLRDQVLPTANYLFGGREDDGAGLVILEISPENAGSPVVVEDLYDAGEKFPHLYGALPKSAVVRTYRLAVGPEGQYTGMELE